MSEKIAMQAITTKYLPATDSKGARIKASCGRGQTTIPYMYGKSLQQNHEIAADMLCAIFCDEDHKANGTPIHKNTWGLPRVCGVVEHLPSRLWVHVLVA